MTGPAELLRDFVNTYDVEQDADELASPADLSVWLRERGLIGDGDRALDEDLALAGRLREGLRHVLRLNHDGGPYGALSELDAALAALPVRVTLAGGVPALVPVAPGVAGGLARVAGMISAAHADGTWARLKVCAEHTCQWAFVDSSKNRSRSWCSMRVCGNRTKTRAYRARRQAEGTPRPS
ncbi:CGNR zinc finger domain-containing protein [Microbispora sp. RL4-1S]|uniref:CGNR zinc finger domain-containing protein n=1 Tax=Microbispora oryzae TaxID=2806554 RepID=A0A940WDW9_9ACTN|nr:CGNR zinc finger domain-containing protein [Microbispora oryzae]MBP2702818.1 CGNR zinc finger domain-containing protein [Microbispora oryzae]